MQWGDVCYTRVKKKPTNTILLSFRLCSLKRTRLCAAGWCLFPSYSLMNSNSNMIFLFIFFLQGRSLLPLPQSWFTWVYTGHLGVCGHILMVTWTLRLDLCLESFVFVRQKLIACSWEPVEPVQRSGRSSSHSSCSVKMFLLPLLSSSLLYAKAKLEPSRSIREQV